MKASERTTGSRSRKATGRIATGFVTGLVLLVGCSGDPSRHPGLGPGRELPPCPDKPNCVSTQSPDAARAMDPLPFIGTREESRNRILETVRGMKRSEVVRVSDATVHVLFRSRVFRFVDDVVFVFDETDRLVHFRSASRVGSYDFGVNRRRMEEVSRRYREGRP